MQLPRLRVTEANGDSWDDPEDDKIFDLVRDLGPDNRFLIVERHDRPSLWQHYMQVYLNDDSTFALEFRDGGPQAHYRAEVGADARDLPAAIIVQWASDQTGWRDALPWKPWQSAEPEAG
jgi:hypothetical protein